MQILTLSGIRVDPWNITSDDVRLEDISGSISKICRYTGHCQEFYSVAQHSVFVALLLQAAGESLYVVKQGLFHDASEAYLTDLNTPTKNHLPDYKEAEMRAERSISYWLGLNFPWSPRVKEADYVAYLLERRHLMPNDRDPDDIACNYAAVEDEIDMLGFGEAVRTHSYMVFKGMPPKEAQALFEMLYTELFKVPKCHS